MDKVALILYISSEQAQIILLNGTRVLGKRTCENNPYIGLLIFNGIDDLLKENTLSVLGICRIGVHITQGPLLRWSSVRSMQVTAQCISFCVPCDIVLLNGENERDLIGDLWKHSPEVI